MVRVETNLCSHEDHQKTDLLWPSQTYYNNVAHPTKTEVFLESQRST